MHAALAEQRAAEAANFQAQAWQEVADEIDPDAFDDFATTAKPKKPKNWNETGMVAEDEEEEEDEEEDGAYECFACNKVFAGQKTWENHERSKKHKQAVWRQVFLSPPISWGIYERLTRMLFHFFPGCKRK